MAASSDLDVNVRGRDELSPSLSQIQSRVIRFVGFVSSAMAAIKVVGFPVDSVRDFEKEMAGVQKTTGFTDGQIKRLGDSLIDMSRKINLSASELAKIAAAAGQQGLGREGVEGIRQFTESVSRMASVLDITVEQAGANIGKIASIFKIPLKDIEDAVSAFNEVANNSTATGEQLLDVVKRIGDAAGSLNLQQSIGLSATGIDLGLSPEVVGSSFQKVFAEMYGRADQFSRLLNMNTNDWMKKVQENGIEALKLYLDGLRKLTPEAQQQTIKALSGGGRIGALVTKLLMDTEDTILDTNVANATRGIMTGTSAIKEQQTVLATLDAQIVKAGNSFKALGIIAGEEFAGRLSAYFSQLNDALADPAVIDFAKALGQAFLDVFDTVAAGIKFVAGLNIQWTSFITVAKIFVGLKLAQVLAGIAFQFPAIAAGWLGMSTAAANAAAAQANASGTMTTAISTQLAQIRLLINGYREYQAAIAAEQAALQANTAAQEANSAAAAQAATARSAYAAGLLAQRSAGQNVTSAKNALRGAEQAGAAAQAAVQNQLNAKLQEAATRHSTAMQRIEQERIAKVQAAQASGNTAAIQAANTYANNQSTIEQRRNTQSLAGLNTYYANRLAIVTRAAEAEITIQRAALAASLSAFDGASRGLGTLQVAAAGATTALNSTSAALANTNTQLTLAQATARAAAAAFSFAGTAVRLLATGFGLLISVLSKVLFWATLVYTALSIFGGLDAVQKFFQKLTDAMGLTSQRGRDLEEQHKRTAEAQKLLKKTADEAADSIANLQKLQDADTGQLSDKTRQVFKIGLSSKDRDEYLKTLDDIVKATAGAEDQLNVLKVSKDSGSSQVEALEKEKAAVLAKLDEMQATYQKRLDKFNTAQAAGGFGTNKGVLAAEKSIKEQEKIRDEIDAKIKQLQTADANNLTAKVDQTKQNLTELQNVLSTTFTDISARTFQNFAEPYLKAMEEWKKSKSEYDVLVSEQSRETDDKRREDMDKELDAARAKVEANKSAMEQIRQALAANIKALKDSGGLSEATVGSLSVLTSFLEKGEGVIQAILNGIASVRNAGGTFTGENAAPPPKPREGDDEFKKETEAEARRLRRARLDLIKAGLEAEADLAREYNSQAQDENEDRYKQNLTSIRAYYAQRLALQRQNLEIEKRLRNNEVASLKDELSQAKEGSEKVRIEAQIKKAEGDLAVLEAQKQALTADNERALRDALREFGERVNEQREALVDYFGNGTDMEAFSASLQVANDKYRQFIERLEVESKNMPELLPIIDQMRMQAAFEAVEKAIQKVGRESTIANGYLEITTQKIAALGEAGLLTRGEVSALEEKNRRAIIAVMEAENARSKALLEQLAVQNNGLGTQTVKYKELQLEIDKRAADIDNLKVKGNEVANRINSDIKGSVNQALVDITTPGNTFSEVFTDFLLSIVNNLRNVAAEGLSDLIMRQLQSVAGGGIGGFFSDLFGSSADTVDPKATATSGATGSAAKALGLLGETRGSTPATPLYTMSVPSPLDATSEGADALGLGKDALGLGAKAADKGGDAAESVANAADAVPTEGFFSDTFTQLGDTVSELGSTVVSGIGSGLAAVGNAVVSGGTQLLSFLGTMMSTLVSAIFTSSSAQAASGAAAGVAGGVAGAAHNGGVIGHTTMSRTNINPAVFANAMRYHTGGQVGLTPDEVPIIAKRGEEVITKEDPRHRDNGGLDGSGGLDPSQAQPVFKVQPVLSEGAVLDAMKGSQGQKLLLVHISKNPAAFRQALKLN